MLTSQTLAILFVFFLTSSSLLAAEDNWGTLTGRFVLDGPIPEPRELKIDKDKNACSTRQFDETLVVNPKDRGIANVFIWLHGVHAAKLPVHPERTKEKEQEVVWTIEGCRFVPHARAMQVQRLVMQNNDLVGHVPRFDFMNYSDSRIIPTSDKLTFDLKKKESSVVHGTCSSHPWMNGYLLVQDHPYFAITDSHGKFSIPKIPTGRWTFQFWHEGKGNILTVRSGGKAETWTKGRKEIEITASGTDLGELTLTAKDLLNAELEPR